MRVAPFMAVAMLLLAACGSGPPARIGDRSVNARQLARLPEAHVVQRGDTLYSIAFRYNLDHRTVAAWNAIGPPYTIYPNQVIWLRPPTMRAVQPAGRPQIPTAQRSNPPERSSRGSAPSTAPAAGATTGNTAAPGSSCGSGSADDIRWVWPVAGGKLNRGFVSGNADRQGIDIGGRPGQPVVAVADGEVVYSGAGFVGYSELIIIKHNEQLLSAYAHNRRRLVAEGDRVKAGQQIAELGRSPRGVDEVYVQIRRNGEPQNPLRYLPER